MAKFEDQMGANKKKKKKKKATPWTRPVRPPDEKLASHGLTEAYRGVHMTLRDADIAVARAQQARLRRRKVKDTYGAVKALYKR